MAICVSLTKVWRRGRKNRLQKAREVLVTDWNGRYELEQSRPGTQQLVSQGPGRLGLETDASLAMYMSKLFL